MIQMCPIEVDTERDYMNRRLVSDGFNYHHSQYFMFWVVGGGAGNLRVLNARSAPSGVCALLNQVMDMIKYMEWTSVGYGGGGLFAV